MLSTCFPSTVAIQNREPEIRPRFYAVHHLKQRGLLSAEEIQTLTQLQNWFEEHLPNPPFYADRSEPTAVTWFKTSAVSMIERLSPLLGILKQHGVDVEEVRNDIPGKIIYEDDFQIAVI